MKRILFSFFLLSCLLTAPRPVSAQEGGFPVKTTARTQFVFQNGEVVQREGSQTIRLTQNVKLPSGVKINYKSGIVELPTGKKTTLREGDYVKADGGIVFATPASAAAARGEIPQQPDAQYEKYVQAGANTTVDPTQQIRLLNQKIDLLNQKVSILSQGRSAMADTRQVDEQLRVLDAQISGVK
ncbi:hypothetical protein GCM10023185_44030 [Hymenobacter saemangeumensis]|uniref:DUF6799 domain-containing protein n=1 Tax=Hymenobacter saemangeumensis TaxID=1084522 RepID=A0ABP8IS51_9BACT